MKDVPVHESMVNFLRRTLAMSHLQGVKIDHIKITDAEFVQLKQEANQYTMVEYYSHAHLPPDVLGMFEGMPLKPLK